MIISDMKNKANVVKKMAKERIARYEEECIEKEVERIFDWLLKVIEEKVKKNYRV